MSWSRRFDEPIDGPDGVRFVTLRDAGEYIQRLPKKVQALPEWDAAASALLVVVGHNGPINFAEMGLLAALNRDKPKPERPRKPKLKIGKRLNAR